MTEHPSPERLDEALAGRLGPAEHREVDAHLAQCDACREELQAMRALRRRLAELEGPQPPAGIEAQISGLLDAEDALGQLPRAGRSVARTAWWAVAAAALLATVTLVGLTWPRPDLVSALADAVVVERAHLMRAAEGRPLSPAQVQASLQDQQPGFPVRVLDLGMMGYRLAGSGVHHVDGRPVALVFYRGPDGRLIACAMLRGSAAALPPADERREHAGITFTVHRAGAVTLVFWPEGEVLCALAGDGAQEELVQLAFAKAEAVAAASLR